MYHKLLQLNKICIYGHSHNVAVPLSLIYNKNNNEKKTRQLMKNMIHLPIPVLVYSGCTPRALCIYMYALGCLELFDSFFLERSKNSYMEETLTCCLVARVASLQGFPHDERFGSLQPLDVFFHYSQYIRCVIKDRY
jgi:hypothetical protein